MHYSPIHCAICGTLTERTSATQKYCPSCRNAANQVVHNRWLQRYPGYMRVANKKNYKKNAHTARVREWRIKNPEPTRVANHNRRAFIRGNGGSFTIEDIYELRIAQHNRCYYCNRELNEEHIDHRTPLSRGGSNYIWNIALACPECNLSKYDKTEDEYMGWKLCQEIRK